MENEIGRIAVGYSADMVAVEENPLTNIRTPRKGGLGHGKRTYRSMIR
jgi:imidazolonepropionase-like amidohydrolase